MTDYIAVWLGPWHATDHVMVPHIESDTGTSTGAAAIRETVLCRYFQPGTARPP